MDALTEDEQRIEAVLVAMDRLVDAVDALAEKRDVGWLAEWQPRAVRTTERRRTHSDTGGQ